MKRKQFKCSLIYLCFLFGLLSACNSTSTAYVCTPCDLPCDELTFSKPGICPHCNMDLIEKPADLILNKIDLEEGSGTFLIEGGEGRKGKTIKVFYHQPKSYNADSRILMVIPGAGRNADSYRDAWIEESEKHNVLIIAPQFKESDYGFEDYHLSGLITNSNLRDCIQYRDSTNIAELDEGKFTFEINMNEVDWIFSDLDRLFDLVIENVTSNQKTYDVFGHSAGGHILHRLAIFHHSNKAGQIIAANPSFYTLTDAETAFPFGLAGFKFSEEDLKYSFSKRLIVFLGERDDREESGGTFLRSSTADMQGLSRVERGQFFYDYASEKAKEIGAEFNWKLEMVSNVGHDHRAMGDAAGKLLYGQ